jgi:hypothetical protein
MVTDHGKPRQSLRRRIALSRAAAIAGDLGEVLAPAGGRAPAGADCRTIGK